MEQNNKKVEAVASQPVNKVEAKWRQSGGKVEVKWRGYERLNKKHGAKQSLRNRTEKRPISTGRWLTTNTQLRDANKKDKQ